MSTPSTSPPAGGAIRLFGQELRLAKSFWEGTQRSCSPEQTVARLQPLAAAVGLTRVADITGLDVIGLPVWVAIRPNARGLSTAQGKGLSAPAARASAMMEAIESWHAEHIDRPVVIESPWALAQRAPVIDWENLNVYADSLPRADQPLAWIEGHDLLRDQACWVPLEAVSTSYVTGVRHALPTAFVQSSNGLAGGNHPLEALLHALAELVERDALARGAAALRRLDPALRIKPGTVADPACRTVLGYLERAGVEAALFDLTSDLGVPVYACTIVDADAAVRWRTLPPFNGYGCHPTPAIALLRAINEAVQSRLTYISGSRDDIPPTEYRRGGNADDLKAYRALLAAAPAMRDFNERRDLAGASFEDDVARMLAVLRSAGIRNVVAVDLSKPGIGVPVIKLVVPGLAAAASLMGNRPIRSPRRENATLALEDA
jgi:YcaO-like protein with predicted kinase domain